ncbi:hypothetical protein EK904_006779 [Melospiza melodia maxima]|nr:hypothetical protein EK904_006779 [Melospiza melodia maxima]
MSAFPALQRGMAALELRRDKCKIWLTIPCQPLHPQLSPLPHISNLQWCSFARRVPQLGPDKIAADRQSCESEYRESSRSPSPSSEQNVTYALAPFMTSCLTRSGKSGLKAFEPLRLAALNEAFIRMNQEGLNGLFVLLRSLCEICSMKFLELRDYRKIFSDLHLPPSLDAPSGWFYSTCFLHWQCVCLLMSIMGLNPLKITSLDSLAAFVKMQPKYLIESSSPAPTGSAIYDCGVTSASPAASHGAQSQPWQT